jgi:hypothetical protein
MDAETCRSLRIKYRVNITQCIVLVNYTQSNSARYEHYMLHLLESTYTVLDENQKERERLEGLNVDGAL